MESHSDSGTTIRQDSSGTYDTVPPNSRLYDNEEATEESMEKTSCDGAQLLEYTCLALCCVTALALALWIAYLGRQGSAEALGSAPLSHSVVTSSGGLRGLWVDTGTGSRVLAFYGVPFAEPPLGASRFQRPVPVQPWQGELRATFKAPPCPPQWLRPTERQRTADWTEDCLHVNVWTPGLSPAKLRPVVLLLHGGQFTHGSNKLRHYDGARLAARCDCVVAVPNYRLGVFGFLFGNVSSFPGNQGLWDQYLAIQWVKGNAAVFGGDPRNLVLWGVDAGAISAGLHILSPLTGSLVSRAVLQGGSPLSCLGESADAETVRLAVAKLCSDDPDREDERRALACLQASLAASLVALPVDDYFAQVLSPFLPTYGDALVPIDPKVLVSERRPPSASSSLSVLVGVVRGEGERWLARFLDASTNGSWAAHFTPDQYRSTASAVFTFAFGEEILEAESLRTDLESLNDGARVFRRYGTLLDDALFVCPALQFADYLSDAAHVRLYELASAEQASQAARQHGEDSDAAHDWGPDDILAQPGTRAFADAVLAFIATGSADWPLYTRTEPVSRYFSRNQTITRKTDAIRTCKPRFECYPGKTRFE